MIRALFYSREGRLIKTEIRGHAMQAPRGEDLVCAGVSSMVQAALNGLEHFIPDKFDYRVENTGAVTIVTAADCMDQEQEKAHIVLKTLELGLRALKDAYPDTIEIHSEEVGSDD